MVQLLDQTLHPGLYQVSKTVDQFREEPDTKGDPTSVGLCLTLVAVPALLSAYFYYIFSTNPTVYATSVLHAGSSQWTGRALCWAEGGCFFAGTFRGNSCAPYMAGGEIAFVPYGGTFDFSQGHAPQYSDGSNVDAVPALLMVASVNATAAQSTYGQTLSSQLLWSVIIDSAAVAQGPTLTDGLSVTYDAGAAGPFRADVHGANVAYAIKVVVAMASITDEVDNTVKGGDAAPLDVGVLVTSSTIATFGQNADVVQACVSSPVFPQPSPIGCGSPFACVAATVTLDPVVTSTTIYKQNTLTELFAQVGGNASNAVVLLNLLVAAYHAIRRRRSGSSATVAPRASQVIQVGGEPLRLAGDSSV